LLTIKFSIREDVDSGHRAGAIRGGFPVFLTGGFMGACYVNGTRALQEMIGTYPVLIIYALIFIGFGVFLWRMGK
jgi:hypothetical protein